MICPPKQPMKIGETVKSAFGENELVLRGSFFRGGAVKDTDKGCSIRRTWVS